jgi:hypothetical protein
VAHTADHLGLTRARRRLTGERHRLALLSMQRHSCSPEHPIPSATNSQSRLEARALYALVDGFRANIILCKNTALGIAAVEPTPNRIVLFPAPGLGLRVLASLLPFNSERGLLGVPGLRPVWEKGCLYLRSLYDEGVIQFHDDGGQLLSVLERGLVHPSLKQEFGEPLWPMSPRMPTPAEQQHEDVARGRPFSDVRARLLSDLLRRHRLLVDIRRAGAHWVDLYDHTRRDLVVEWDCGPDDLIVSREMVKAGLYVRLNNPARWSSPDSRTSSSLGSFLPGEGPILLRRQECQGTRSWEPILARGESDLLTTSLPVPPRRTL